MQRNHNARKWGRTEYINSETGEIIWSKEIKKYVYKILEEQTIQDRGYTVTRKIIQIKATQQELWIEE